MTRAPDIRPGHLEIVQGISREHLCADVKVWVFGSRASWTRKDSSDLKLALECDSRLSHKLPGVLKDASRDSALPYTVDVVDINRIGEPFRHIVESQKTPLPAIGDGVKQKVRSGASVTDRADCGGAIHSVTSSQWREAKLGDITELLFGDTPSRSRGENCNGSVPWVTATDMKQLRLYETGDLITQAGVENGTRVVPANTVLVLVPRMTLLNDVPVSIAQRPMALNRDIKAIRPKSEVDEEFPP